MTEPKPVSRIAEFTAGPWEVATDYDGETYIKAGDEAVVDARWEGGSHTSLGVSDADARLIVAAPDMYEALEVFARHASAGDQRPKDDAVWAGQDGLAITYGDFRRAAKALAKARGEAA